MSGQEQQEGSELPTPYKLERARKQGSAPRSMEMTGVAALAMALIVATTAGQYMTDGIARIFIQLLNASSQLSLTPQTTAGFGRIVLTEMLQVLAPLFFSIVIIVVLSILIQIGPAFSPEVLKPKWERVNPAAGLKRLFSKKSIVDTLKASVKLTFLALLMYMLIAACIGRFPALHAGNGEELFSFTRAELIRYGIRILLLLIVFAIVDVALVRREFLKKMMMTRRDLRDEHKNREGDPRIKSKIRQLRQEMLRKTQAITKVPSADLLLTNPTHIAVALRYKRGEDMAPRVIAKGAGELAASMREVAYRHGIPVIHMPRVAREIFYHSQLETFIPSNVFPQVAKIMAWVLLSRGKTEMRTELRTKPRTPKVNEGTVHV